MVKSVTQKITFVSGKGGVGKTAVSHALALRLARTKPGKKILWITFEDPAFPPGLRQLGVLSHLNAGFLESFDEYAQLKLGSARLASFFSQSKVMRFLAQVAPGFRDLVLIGKAWQIRNDYDHLVLDMPATGHSLTMFQSTINFRRAFGVGPLARDADQMLETFASPEQCAAIIVALPEETPLVEGLELGQKLQGLFPKVIPQYVVNRVWQVTGPATPAEISLVPRSAAELLASKKREEARNIAHWDDRGVKYGQLPRLTPPPSGIANPVLELAGRLEAHL